MNELTREQVESWCSNVQAPGPVLAVNPGASRRIGESWLRLLARAEAAEAELAQARELLFNFVEFYDLIEMGGPDDGQTDREFVMELVGHRKAARAFMEETE